MFSEEQQERQRGREGGGSFRRVWWPHVAVAARSLDFAGFRAERPCRDIYICGLTQEKVGGPPRPPHAKHWGSNVDPDLQQSLLNSS